MADNYSIRLQFHRRDAKAGKYRPGAEFSLFSQRTKWLLYDQKGFLCDLCGSAVSSY